jgi:hypothetical protein
MDKMEIKKEKERILITLKNADENKILTMDALINQMAYETIYLKYLTEVILKTDLTRFKYLKDINNEVVKHSATLTHITDKVLKHLSIINEEDEGEYMAQYD